MGDRLKYNLPLFFVFMGGYLVYEEGKWNYIGGINCEYNNFINFSDCICTSINGG